MKNNLHNSIFIMVPTIAIIGWFAVFLQLFLIIQNRVASVPETIIRFFSFFTIQTNILVAICFSFLWLRKSSKLGIFFSNPKNSTAITLYILIVGIVYNVILRFLWTPTGYQKLVDELLHSLIPVLVFAYWFLADKKTLVYKNIILWLIFPSLYLIYTLVRGYFFGFYPYPFVDVIKLGYQTVLKNCFFMVLAFLIVGFILIGISKFQTKNSISHDL